MDRTYIDINVPNVITIVLINVFGAIIIGFVLKLYNQSSAGNSAAASAVAAKVGI
jgi:fluoride ion exporter CrcB/FEX